MLFGGGYSIIEYNLLIFIVFLAMVFDLRTDKIPNGYILISFIVSILFQILSYSISVAVHSVAISILICIILIPIYYIRAIGAGDVKLFVVIGSLVGFKMTIYISICAFLLGGFISIYQLCHKKIFLKQMKAVSEYLYQITVLKKVIPYTNRLENNENLIHFSCPILLSVLIVIGGETYLGFICNI